MSTIQKILSEWREMHYAPTYAELEAVAAEQQELLDALEVIYRHGSGCTGNEMSQVACAAINRHKGASI